MSNTLARVVTVLLFSAKQQLGKDVTGDENVSVSGRGATGRRRRLHFVALGGTCTVMMMMMIP